MSRDSEAMIHACGRPTKIEMAKWQLDCLTRAQFGGFVGSATFERDLTAFAPLLPLGEVVHVGKATPFGLGKHRVIQWE